VAGSGDGVRVYIGNGEGARPVSWIGPLEEALLAVWKDWEANLRALPSATLISAFIRAEAEFG